LDQAVELTRSNLPALRQAHAAAVQAGAASDEARAARYPTIAATLSYKRTTGNPASSPGPSLALPAPTLTTYNYFANSLSVSELLWDFGQTPNRIASAEETARSQRESERFARVQAELAVRTAFFTAAAQRALVSVAETNLGNNDTHLAETKAFVKEGKQPEIALATAEASRANAIVQLISARNAYATAKARLNQAMGAQGSSNTYDVEGSPSAPMREEDAPLDSLTAEALGARPDQAALQAERRAAEATIKANLDTWLPALSAAATATDNGTTLAANSRLGLTPNAGAGLVLSWSVNAGPFIPAQVRAARAALASVEAQLDALQLQVRVEVETAQLAVKAARESLLAAFQAREAASTQLRLANGRYAAGVGNAVEVSDAQLAADQSGAQAVQAQFTLDAARAQLVAALGRTS